MNASNWNPALPRGFAFVPDDLARRVYMQPDGIVFGPAAEDMVQAGHARRLAGGPGAFAAARLILKTPESGETTVSTAPLIAMTAWAQASGERVAHHMQDLLTRIERSRAPFAGPDLEWPRLMAVVNVTPDSFSDGGDHLAAEAAIAHGRAMLAAGADSLDVGGESTRPGAAPVPVEEELRRVLPVVRALAAAGGVVSIDTRRAAVMRAALDAGACIVNDVTALTGDSDSVAAIAASGASVVLMHMQGEPRTMQQDPRYGHAPTDIYDFLESRIAACVVAGIDPSRIAIDPGIGFGKTLAHNLEVLEAMSLYQALGTPVVLGVSRKRFIGRLSREEPPKARVSGSIAAGLAGLDRGVQMLRVHDLAETRQAVSVWSAVRHGADRLFLCSADTAKAVIRDGIAAQSRSDPAT